jgi:hypothetical protein
LLVGSLGNGRANLSRFIVAYGYFWLIVAFRLITSPHAFFPALWSCLPRLLLLLI